MTATCKNETPKKKVLIKQCNASKQLIKNELEWWFDRYRELITGKK